MRDLVYKNITSPDKRKRIITSTERFLEAGIRTTVARHFICIFKKVHEISPLDSKPHIYLFRHRDNRKQQEKFLCRIRGSICFIQSEEIFIVEFCHSVKINMEAEKALS
ncbi:MAG: hypothetical protein NC829_03400 [Candidatus Omnitrophica bacterium]|nr:hypothetical protein [Candidatus Omnitrophota bacterium]